MTAPESAEPARTRRLHPMTFLQRVIVSAPGVVLLLLPLFREDGGRNPWVSITFALLYGCVAVPLMFLQYAQFRYTITPREIQIRSGVLTRRSRSIPVNRVQNIEIEQTLLPRLFGAAKVKIETAGSTKTEGVLELVSLEEAREVRRLIRAYQLEPGASGSMSGEVAQEPAPVEATVEAGETLLVLPLRRALLSGVFRFSLLYIALIFSGLQYVGLDPEGIVRLFERGPLRPLSDFAAVSPWTALSLAALTAGLLSWLTGIAVNLNRYYGFQLSQEPGKLHMKHGLLTVAERTIPVRRVQAVVFRTNPLMRRFGWWRLELQTMGLDVQERGHQVLAPFVRWEEALQLAARVRPLAFPASFSPVSRLHIRRRAIRNSLILIACAATLGLLWTPGWWLLLALPGAFYLAVLDYRNHGYAIADDALYVRRGVLRHQIWLIPFNRLQVFYASASVFQRRLGLKSLYTDTAGAHSFVRPQIMDLPAGEADAQLAELYQRYRTQSA